MAKKNSIKRAFRGLMALTLAAVIAAAASASPGTGGLTSVRVRDRSDVETDQILLGAIAQIDGDDADMVRTLKGLVIGRSPLPGKTRSLDAATLISRLRQNGIDPERLDLQVPSETILTRGALTIDRAEIEQIVRRFLQQQLAGTPGGAATVKDIRVPEAIVVPKGPLTTHVSAPKASELSGSVPLQVTFAVEPDFERRIWVTVSLERRVKAVVARRPLGRFKPLEAGDLDVKALDLADLPADWIEDPDAVIGKLTRRALDSGTVLRPDLLEFPALVKRGDRVRIIAESAGMRISAFGQAKQKGGQGEMIPVVNLDSNRVVHARVVDSRTVRIEF